MTAQRPPRIRTDSSNPFANHTLRVRVPAIVDEVRQNNPDYPAPVQRELAQLAEDLRQNAVLPGLDPASPHADTWLAELERRQGERWLDTDWFFAENYAYRQLVERVGFFRTARDPFISIKREDYASRAHAEAFARALELEGPVEQRIPELLKLVLFGNRMDLSFAAARERGTHSVEDDLVCDDRQRAAALLLAGDGALHLVIDNAGTELTLDLVLADFAIHALGLAVVLHLKVHPTFVSDAICEDVLTFMDADAQRRAPTHAERACLARLDAARRRGALELAPHPYFNGPLSLWELPRELEQRFREARLVILKGDAHYRRALGDAIWPPDTPFTVATDYFPAPLLALRTLKSDPIVGLAPGRADQLTRLDPTWRVNAQRAVASLGGKLTR